MGKLTYYVKISIRPVVCVSEFRFEPQMFAHHWVSWGMVVVITARVCLIFWLILS